jgi:hypothetical protein
VAAQVEDEREDADGREVCGDEREGSHRILRNLLVGCVLRSTAKLCRCCDGT